MASIVLLSLFFALQAQLTGGVVHLSANPVVIDLGLTSLTVRCDVNQSNQHNMSTVLSIIVSRSVNSSSPYTDLASLIAYTGERVNVLTSENLIAEGSIQATGNSFLELYWEHPREEQSGHYMCACQGLDVIGHNVNLNVEVEVTSRRPGSDQLLDKIRDLDLDLQRAYEKLTQFNISFTHLARDVIVLQQHNNAMERQRKNWFFIESSHDDNTTYSMSRHGYINLVDAEALCQIYGGYLVEIKDANEFTLVQAFLNNSTNAPYLVYTGIFRENQQAVYTFIHSNKPVQFLKWHQGDPSNVVEESCVYLRRDFNYEFPDYLK